jgi:hypothetical protein
MKLSYMKTMQKEILIRKKYHHDLGGHARCKDSITIKEALDFVRVGEEKE